MRVTDGMRYTQATRNLMRLRSDHARAAEEATTGNRLGKPSNDPGAAAEVTRLRSAMSQVESFRKTISTVQGDVELTESTLGQASTIFQRAHEIAMAGANGALTAADRSQLALEVADLKKQVVDLANTQGSRGYIFGGSQTDAPPFSDLGVYSGDSNDQVVKTGTGPATVVSVSGDASFAVTGGRDVFADLDALELALSTDNGPGIAATLGDIEASRKQLVDGQSRAGLILRRLETADQVYQQLEVDNAKHENALAGADPIDAFSRLTTLGQSLENAIAVSRQILDTGSMSRF